MRNQKSDCDILIAGAGPAGTITARKLASEYSVTVLEEHSVSGKPVQCTGLVSDDVIERSGVKVDALNSLYGANIIFPGGGVLSARSDVRKALIIDRSELDGKMASAAIDAGAEIHYGTKYESHVINDGVTTETSSGTVTSEMMIGADGHSSRVAASIGNNGPKEYVRGLQIDIAHRLDDQGMLDLYIGSEYAPGFFAWVIPFGDVTRVGLCSTFNDLPPAEYLKNLLRKTGLQDKTVIEKHSGKIPLGGRRRTYGDNLLLIGDAAGQVKPISGGGLQPIFHSVDPLCETVREAFDSDNMSSSFLSIYEKRWNQEIGKELKRGYSLRKTYVKMRDDEFDKVFGLMNKEDIISQFNGIDIDNPSSVARPILKKNLSLAFGLMPIGLKTLFR